MDRACQRDRLAGKLCPIERSAGIGRGGILGETPLRQHGEGRQGNPCRAQTLDEAAPAPMLRTAWQLSTELVTRSHVVAPAGRSAASPVTFRTLACTLRGRACRSPSPCYPRQTAAIFLTILTMLRVGIRKQRRARA